MGKDIEMIDESYEIDLEITVQESDNSPGNIYISSIFKSHNELRQPLNFNRMAHLKPKASIILTMKQLLSYVPMLCYFLNCQT